MEGPATSDSILRLNRSMQEMFKREPESFATNPAAIFKDKNGKSFDLRTTEGRQQEEDALLELDRKNLSELSLCKLQLLLCFLYGRKERYLRVMDGGPVSVDADARFTQERLAAIPEDDDFDFDDYTEDDDSDFDFDSALPADSVSVSEVSYNSEVSRTPSFCDEIGGLLSLLGENIELVCKICKEKSRK